MKYKYDFINILQILVLLQIIIILHSEIDYIIRLGDETFRYLSFASNLNRDMIILISSSNTENSIHKIRKIYGLKSNGRFFFYENNKETPFRTFTSSLSFPKKSSTSCFIQLSTDDENNGKEYLFSISTGASTVDIYDLESGIISEVLSITFFQNYNIQSNVSSLFKIEKPESKYYYFFAKTINSSPDYPVYIFRDYFESSTISRVTFSELRSLPCTNSNTITCFETSQYRIVCLY